MIMKTTLTAGYVSFGTQFYEPENLKMITAGAEKQLTDAGISLVRTDPVTGEEKEPLRAIRELKSGEWDFLFVNILNWIDTRGVFRVLHEFRNEPMILYSYGGFTDHEGRFGEKGTLISPAAGAGSTSLRFPMEQWGIKFKYLFNAPDAPMDIEGILSFARAAYVKKHLKQARLGMIGYNDMGLYSTGINPTRLRDEIGPEIESMDMLQLQKKMDSLGEEEVMNETKRVTTGWEYPLGKPAPEVIGKAVRMYMATVELCKEKNFSTFSYKCVDGIDLEMGLTHAVPSSLVADAGYPYVDENDLGNSVAQLMLKWISGKQVTFIEHYEHHPEWILLGEDGYCPADFIEGKPQIKDVSTVLLKGIAHCSNMKKGRMTLACLSETKSGYRMHIVTGEGKERPKWVEMGVPLPSWPSITFYPDAPVRQVLDHVQSQHFAAVYGTYIDELVDLCKLLDIEFIADVK
jgi:L-fucose isomerase-like protein